MFEQEKFWYNKCFANNRNDSKINIVQYKIRSVRVVCDKEGFRFYFFYFLEPGESFEMKVCLLMGW